MNTLFETNFKAGKGKTSNVWFTPKNIIDGLEKFDLDVCTSDKRPFNIGLKSYTPKENGLICKWHGLVWCNPPYGKHSNKWIAKCINHDNCIVLIFVRTDTKLWQKLIFPNATGFLFLDGRISFIDDHLKQGGGSGSPSVLVAFGNNALNVLKKSSLKGKLILNK